MIDIVNIKNAKYLRFYVENNYIFCENIKTGERIIVGEICGIVGLFKEEI